MKEEEGCVTPVADLASGVWEIRCSSPRVLWTHRLTLRTQTVCQELWDVGQKCYESVLRQMQTGLTEIQQTAQPLESVFGVRNTPHDLLKEQQIHLNYNNNNNTNGAFYFIITEFQILLWVSGNKIRSWKHISINFHPKIKIQLKLN